MLITIAFPPEYNFVGYIVVAAIPVTPVTALYPLPFTIEDYIEVFFTNGILVAVGILVQPNPS